MGGGKREGGPGENCGGGGGKGKMYPVFYDQAVSLLDIFKYFLIRFSCSLKA